MHRHTAPHSTQSPRRQQGIATILVVILIGIGLTATALGIVHSVRSTQEKHIAVHAATHAQTGVWAGVEALRRYLGMLEEDDLKTLSGLLEIEFPYEVDDYGTITAENVEVTAVGSLYRVNAQVINRHGLAQASSALEVVFEVDPNACPNCLEMSAALDFYDSLVAEGQITFVLPNATMPAINVDGDIDMINVGGSAIGRLSATGSIRLDSQVAVDHLHANGDVILSGSATVEKIETLGSVTTSGGAGARVLWANGEVNYGGNYNTVAINSLSNIDLRAANHDYLRTAGDIQVSNAAVNRVGDLFSQSDVRLTHGIPVGHVLAEGDFYCPNAGWDNFESISINGLLSMPSCTQAALALDRTQVGANHSIPVMNPIKPFVMPPLVVDVWALKSRANYVVEFDQSVGRTKVTVFNIAGQTNGTEYWLGDYPSGNQNSFLCKTFDGAGKCATPTPTLSICLGHSLYNNCLIHTEGADGKPSTWEFNGTSAAPGVFWFKGNLHLNNGYNYGTFLATGNVVTGGMLRVEAVNYAAYSEICLATGTAVADHLRPAYNSRFKGQYPTNLCDIDTESYLPDPVGNIAIAAGGFDPEGPGAFSGGDITLGTSNKLYGTVLAGGVLKTGGQTEVFGHVTAAVQASKGGEKNLLGGSTTIDLSKGSDTYDPGKIPRMDIPDCATGCEPPNSNERAKLIWSRYF